MSTERQHGFASAATSSERVPQAVSTEERDLVYAVLGKDRKGTAEFVARYTHSVYGYVKQRLAPRSDFVDNLVQDVFVAALQRTPRLPRFGVPARLARSDSAPQG